MPFLFRTEEQHKRPFLNCDSKVSKSGLKLLHFESRSCTFLEAYKKEIEGKISPENEEGMGESLTIDIYLNTMFLLPKYQWSVLERVLDLARA